MVGKRSFPFNSVVDLALNQAAKPLKLIFRTGGRYHLWRIVSENVSRGQICNFGKHGSFWTGELLQQSVQLWWCGKVVKQTNSYTKNRWFASSSNGHGSDNVTETIAVNWFGSLNLVSDISNKYFIWIKEIFSTHTGQITIIPKPELRGFGEDSPTKRHYWVTSAEVVIIYPDISKVSQFLPLFSQAKKQVQYDMCFQTHRKTSRVFYQTSGGCIPGGDDKSLDTCATVETPYIGDKLIPPLISI